MSQLALFVISNSECTAAMRNFRIWWASWNNIL